MIKSVVVNNFKCFESQHFSFGKLNISCGANGVGKSSLVQALLIGREAFQCNDNSIYVKLNNLFAQDLGQVGDVLYAKASAEIITFDFTCDETHFVLSAPADKNRAEEHFLRFASVPPNGPACFASRETGYFSYLSPERDGPRDIQRIQSAPTHTLQIGTSGEYVAEVLKTFERESVRQKMRYPDLTDLKTPEQLLPQLQRWANEVFNGIELKTVGNPGTNSVGIRAKKGGLDAEWLKPTNIGFGISYCLPVLLGGLLGQENGLLIIDSPEAHLHPASQSKISQFLSQVANAGTQVIVETHSDHILNGIRLAVAKEIISSDDVQIYHFDQIDRTLVCDNIAIKRDGSLSKWPKGFFDQTEKDLAEIIQRKRSLE